MEAKFKPEEIYINLKKLSEEQIKALPQVIENSGDKVLPETLSDLIRGKITDGFKFLFYSPSGWNQNDYPLNGRTELTYPEFIKLFEGGEGEVLQVENDYQDLKESHSELFRRLNQLRNRYKLDNLDKCLGRAKEINRKYANNNGFKIVQSDKNNVFFLD